MMTYQYDYGVEYVIPIYCWLIEGSDKIILIDTGLLEVIQNDFKCVNAIFYAHELEFESVYNPHPLDFRYMAEFIEEIDKGGQMVHIKNEIFEVVSGITMIHTPAHTKGRMSVLINTEKGILGITGMEVIPPGTNINPYLAYDVMLKFKNMVDILVPLHEPTFASLETIP